MTVTAQEKAQSQKQTNKQTNLKFTSQADSWHIDSLNKLKKKKKKKKRTSSKSHQTTGDDENLISKVTPLLDSNV